MKKLGLIITAFVAFVTIASAQKTGIIAEVFRQSVDDKITYMQELIKLDDEQVIKLNELELNFLFNIQKAENCFLCNKKRRIQKLKENRDAELQKILTREQYIKYDAVENDRIKNIPVHL